MRGVTLLNYFIGLNQSIAHWIESNQTLTNQDSAKHKQIKRPPIGWPFY